MTKHDFFRIAVKLLGVYILINYVLTWLPFYIETISYIEISNEETLLGFLLYFGTGICLNLAIALFFIFKPDFIINKLKLTEGFENDYIDNQHFNKRIFKIVILIIAILTIINNAYLLFHELQSMKEFADMNHSFTKYNKTNLIIILVELVISIFVIKERSFVFNLLKLNEPDEQFVESEEVLDNEL